MDLTKAIKSRKSIRRFTNKKPDWRVILECIDSTRFAPMAGNIFTLKFILVDEKQKIDKLAQAAQQEFLSQAKYIVIACSNNKQIINAYGETGKKYSRQQAGAAIQNFLLKLQEKGLSTCWTGHFSEQIVRQIIEIPDNIEVEALFPIGFEHPRSSKKLSKINFEDIIFFNTYDNSRMKKLKKFY